MMSGGGSSLNGILETEKVKRERERESFVSSVNIQQPSYGAMYTATESSKSTVTTGRKRRERLCKDIKTNMKEYKRGGNRQTMTLKDVF